MRRISVIGSSSGAGKTSFGRRLAAQLGLRFIELDALHWGPAWTPLDADTFRGRVEPELGTDGWVIDGNYGKLGELIYERADTVVWLDVPLRVALWRIVRRTLRRIRRGEALWSGNRETVRKAFFSRDSLVLYALRTYRRRRRRWEAKFAPGRYPHLNVLRFRSNADAEQWLATLSTRRGPETGPLLDPSGGQS